MNWLIDFARDSFLEGLKVTNQIAAQRESFSRSELRQRAAVVGLSTMMKRLVSSANKRILDLIFLTISLMYNKNNRGPSIEPCGSPALM